MTVRLAVRGLLAVLLATTAGLRLPLASACPFCSVQGQTLSGEVGQADFIVLGTLKNAKRDPDDVTKGTTELHIDTVVKPHAYLDGKKLLVLPRYVPADPTAADGKYLVFCSVYAGTNEVVAAAAAGGPALGNVKSFQLDAYRGEPAKADSKLPAYLKGSLAVREKDAPTRLKYYFDYLDSAELVVGSDAFMEFGNADYKDVRAVAPTLSADKVLKWLKDPNTPASRFGLYGLIAGHCGKKEDAETLRKLLDDPAKSYSSGLDGMLAGYLLLDPKAGWEYLTQLIKNEKAEFPVRYAGLKVLRFLWEYRPDVVTKADVLGAMATLVGQSDLADLPIEDLRKWERWDMAQIILENGAKESHASVPIVRRAVLRFVLCAPAGTKGAAEYIAAARKADPERVKMTEDLLKDERAKPAGEATTRK